MIAGRLRSGMIATVSLRLLYLIFERVLGPVLLMGRTACGCPKLCTQPLTCCFAASRRTA